MDPSDRSILMETTTPNHRGMPLSSSTSCEQDHVGVTYWIGVGVFCLGSRVAMSRDLDVFFVGGFFKFEMKYEKNLGC